MRVYLRDKLPKETFIDLYFRQNMSLQEIAGIVGYSTPAVTQLKTRYGIPTKPVRAYADKRREALVVKLKTSHQAMKTSAKTRGNIKKRLSKDLLERLYCVDKKSLEDIGTIFGCSRMYVLKLCREYGIARRSKTTARVQAMRQRKFPDKPYYQIDETFFSRWSPASAYVFGLLVTDGHISAAGGGTYQVRLSSNDRTLLEKVRRLMSSSHPINRVKQQPRLHFLCFARERMIHDLLRLGLTPRKSFTIKFPDMPEQFRRHFIRGCWDGDGSVYLERRARCPLRASFTSGSKEFIRTLEEVLHEDARLAKRTIYHSGKSYYFRYSQKDAEKLFHYLYDNVATNMYLERKHQKFMEGISARCALSTQMELSIQPEAHALNERSVSSR